MIYILTNQNQYAITIETRINIKKKMNDYPKDDLNYYVNMKNI